MGEAGSPKNSHDATVEATLSSAEIQKFEQDINDHKGIWLYFDKLPPAEEDAAETARAQNFSRWGFETRLFHGFRWQDLRA